MQKIIMLGTGMGSTVNLFNTCFALKNDDEYFLIDTGGGINIIENLKKSGIGLDKIHNIFISHCHTDHILGLFWLLKLMTGMITGKRTKRGVHNGVFNIYCNSEVKEAILAIYPHLYPKPMVDEIKTYLNIIVLKDGDTLEIANRKYTFFDTKARGNLLYGFETILDNNKKLVFLGDETCNPSLYERIKNSEYVMHEAFCLDSEADIFKPYDINHSTVKSTCESFKELNIKNLILYHTEETHKNRKELYLKEGEKYFNGNVLVPDDLEVIDLC